MAILDDTLEQLESKLALKVPEILQLLFMSDTDDAYLYVYPEKNRDKVVRRPTRFYLPKPAIRTLITDSSRFVANELQIDMFHQLSVIEDGHDLAFMELDEIEGEYESESKDEYASIVQGYLGFNPKDNTYITPWSNPVLYRGNQFKPVWSNPNRDKYTTSICSISPKSVYVRSDSSLFLSVTMNDNLQEDYPPELKAAQLLHDYVTKNKISIKDTKNQDLIKMIDMLCPGHEFGTKATLRITQLIGSGVSRRGRVKSNIEQ